MTHEQDEGSWSWCHACRGVLRGRCPCTMHQDNINTSNCPAHRGFGHIGGGCHCNVNAKPPTPEPQWIVNDLAELGVRVNGRFYFLYKGESLQYETGLHDDNSPTQWRPVGKREFGECCYPALERDQRFLAALDDIRDRMTTCTDLRGPFDPAAEALRFAYEKIRDGMRRKPGPYTAGDGWHPLSDLSPDAPAPLPTDFVGTPKP